jgi:hypothetical protein
MRTGLQNLAAIIAIVAASAVGATTVEDGVHIGGTDPNNGKVTDKPSLPGANTTKPVVVIPSGKVTNDKEVISKVPPKEGTANWKTIQGVKTSLKFELAQGDQCVRVLADLSLTLKPCRTGGIVNWAFWSAEGSRIRRAGLIKDCIWGYKLLGKPNASAAERKVGVGHCLDKTPITKEFMKGEQYRTHWSLMSDGKIVMYGWSAETDGANFRFKRSGNSDGRFTEIAPVCLASDAKLGRLVTEKCGANKPNQKWKMFREHVRD